ncbi:glycosyltransferase [Dyadobacter sp. OTU695]|uniref:glycosyltransferase n=1 Tax=Dyadobacter sp. OTU695 TaxID=3043860 RepID=UPI00313D13E4
MKIGVFMHDLSSGGAEKIMVGFVNYLADLTNDEVVLILANTKGPYLSIVNPKVKIVSFDRHKTSQIVAPLYRYLKAEPVDVLYSTLRNANLIAIIIGKLLGIKVITREANTIKEYNKTKKKQIDKATMFLTRHLYKYAYKCIAISENVKTDLIRFTSLEEKKIEVAYNPIKIFDNITDVSLDPAFFHIGLVSRLTTQKNIPTVARVVEHFLQSNYPIKFHFFGEGDERAVLENLAKRYPHRPVVELHGFELSYYSFIKHMDMFMHIPLWEGLGNSVLEVYNSGIPMILSNVESGFSELIKPDFPNVHYFHPLNEVDLIAEVIEKYIKGELVSSPDRPKLNLAEKDTYNAYRQLAHD